jgi:hypothetical protein
MKLGDYTINNFVESEFPDSLELADPWFISSLDRLRDEVGSAIFPSPVAGALARLDGSTTSQHYAVNRLSKACDVFFKADSFKAYTVLLRSGLFSGIGVYFDVQYMGKPHVMFHLDQRKTPLMWYRDYGSYHYEYESGFYRNLLNLFHVAP